MPQSPHFDPAKMHGSIPMLFVKFAIPNVLVMLFFGLKNLILSMAVGNTLGATALGGVSIILPLFNLVTVVAVVIAIGCQTLVSQALGSDDHKQVHKVITTGFMSLFVIGVLISLVVWLGRKPIIGALGADSVLFPHSLGYLSGLAPFIVSLMLAFYLDAMLRSLGKPVQSTLVMAGTVILDIMMSLAAVLWLDLGLFGASLASGLAFSLAVVGLLVLMPTPSLLLRGKFSPKTLGKACYVGSSEGVLEFSGAMTVLMINHVMMSHAGAYGVSAYTVVGQVGMMVLLIFFGVCNGMIPVMAYHYGANQLARLKQIIYFTAKIVIGLEVLMFGAVQMFKEPIIASFFGQGDKQAIQLAHDGSAIFTWAFLVQGGIILAVSLFTAMSKAVISAAIALLRGVVFMALGVLILPSLFGVQGVWLTLVGSEMLSLAVSVGLVYYFLFKSAKNTP